MDARGKAVNALLAHCVDEYYPQKIAELTRQQADLELKQSSFEDDVKKNATVLASKMENFVIMVKEDKGQNAEEFLGLFPGEMDWVNSMPKQQRNSFMSVSAQNFVSRLDPEGFSPYYMEEHRQKIPPQL